MRYIYIYIQFIYKKNIVKNRVREYKEEESNRKQNQTH